MAQIIDSEHYIFHNEAVRTVFEGAGALLRGNLDFISKNYNRPIPAEEAILIALILGSDALREQTKREERVNMCTAMAGLEEECRQRGFKNGMEAGRKVGIKEGMQEGRKEGMEQGILEKAREVAIKLYKNGNSLEAIAELVEVKYRKPKNGLKRSRDAAVFGGARIVFECSVPLVQFLSDVYTKRDNLLRTSFKNETDRYLVKCGWQSVKILLVVFLFLSSMTLPWLYDTVTTLMAKRICAK